MVNANAYYATRAAQDAARTTPSRRRYQVTTVHGEARTLYHVTDTEAPEAEQPAILATVHRRERADNLAARLNRAATSPVLRITP